MPDFVTTVLLPSHSLEDFPTYHSGKDADSLLANWTVAWHPTLIARSKKMPSWENAETLPEDLADSLFLVPTVSRDCLPFNAQQQVESQGGRMLVGFADRQRLVDAIFDAEDIEDFVKLATPDFFALGYVFLQVQLMTRQLRGTSNLDQAAFEASLVAAAEACAHHDKESMQQHLQRCFDLVIEEKNNYYPVPSSFIELILVAETTIGSSLKRQLERRENPEPNSNSHSSNYPANLLISSSLLRKVKDEQPWWEMLQRELKDGRILLVGGLDDELPFRLLTPDALVRSLEAYRETVESMGLSQDRESLVFAQRSPGLTGTYPRILESSGAIGALHVRFEPVRFPQPSASNIRWEGEQAGGIVAISEEPKDASRADSFLRLGIDIGEQIDSAHLSTILFAHWPDKNPFCI